MENFRDMIMMISNKRKIYVILFALTMQFSLWGMTENHARGLAVLAGGCSAAFVARHSDDPRIVLGALVLPGAYAYYYLQRYTSKGILGQMEKSLVYMTKDPLASGYQTNFASKSDDDDAFIKKISTCASYQKEILKKHPLIMAVEELHAFQKIIPGMEDLLVKTCETAQKDGLGKKWSKLDKQVGLFGDNTKEAIGRIINLPQYQVIKMAYDQSQITTEQLAINKKNAQINEQNAKTAEENLRIAQQNAKTASSYMFFKWVRLFFGKFFGYKGE